MSASFTCIRFSQESLLTRTVRTVLEHADPSALPPRSMDVLPSLLRPEHAVRFSVPWINGGRIRTAKGFYASFTGTAVPADRLVLGDGLTADRTETLAFLGSLAAGFCGHRPRNAVLCLDTDPSRLEEGESMILCRSLVLALERCGISLAPGALSSLPRREQGYLAVLSGDASPAGDVLSPAQASACAVCHLADRSMRRIAGLRPEGRTALVCGAGPVAEYTAEYAARLGLEVRRRARSSPDDAGDVLFLCDPEAPLDLAGAAALTVRPPCGVFEAALTACAPEATALLSGVGIPFLPAIVTEAAVLAAGRALPGWSGERRLRTAGGTVLDAILDAQPEDPFRGACSLALRGAAESRAARGLS